MNQSDLKSSRSGSDRVRVAVYDSEQALVEHLLDRIDAAASPWESQDVATEFSYGRGRTDVLVGLGGEVVAIEAKLTKWRDALDQAYRNMCFAHYSFVCVPVEVAVRAVRHAAEFQGRGVGLCTIDGNQIVILCDAAENQPFQPWLSAEAVAATRKAIAPAE